MAVVLNCIVMTFEKVAFTSEIVGSSLTSDSWYIICDLSTENGNSHCTFCTIYFRKIRNRRTKKEQNHEPQYLQHYNAWFAWVLAILTFNFYNDYFNLVSFHSPTFSFTSVRPVVVFSSISEKQRCVLCSCDNLCTTSIPSNVCTRVTICAIALACKVITFIQRGVGTIGRNFWFY